MIHAFRFTSVNKQLICRDLNRFQVESLRHGYVVLRL